MKYWGCYGFDSKCGGKTSRVKQNNSLETMFKAIKGKQINNGEDIMSIPTSINRINKVKSVENELALVA